MYIIANLPTKLMAVLILLVALPMVLLLIIPKHEWAYYWQDQLFSPGKINFKHLYNEREKIFCQDCHQPGKGIANNSCSKCHTPSWFQKTAPFLADSHQAFAQKDRCVRCHGEHMGYNATITLVKLTPEEHQQLPINPEQCVTCHREIGKYRHPTLVNTECSSCHENFSWQSNFKHVEYLARAKTSQEMLLLCARCHQPNHHYNEKSNLDNRAGCIFCHVRWGKWRKNKDLPFPEALFKDIKVDPKQFNIKLSEEKVPREEQYE